MRARKEAAKEAPLLAELAATPGNFAFPQAVRLMREYLESLPAEGSPPALRFRVNPNLSFPPGDIYAAIVPSSVSRPVPPHAPARRDRGRTAELVLNLMGLHGAGSPLPAYFTEYVAQNQDDPDPLRDFFDIFNHRLISLLYETWGKYRYYALFQPGAADRLSERFFSFIGLGHREIRRARSLNWSKLLPFMGLIAFNGDAAGSLESIMRHYFSHDDVSIIPCIVRKVPIPEDQRIRLGVEYTTLGTDCLLGEIVPDQTGKFRIRIAALHWETFNGFLPCNAVYRELYELVRLVLRSRLHFDLELRLLPEDIRPLHIGERTVCRLGWSSWLGEDGDGIVVL